MSSLETKEIVPRPVQSVGTTEAARLLGISVARIRVLLKQKRIKGASKLLGSRFWAIPLYNGMPSVRRTGKRGPKPKWKSYRGDAKTIIHAYKNHIGKKYENGEYKPPLAVQNSRTGNYSAYALDLEGPCTFYYEPDNPRRCSGARLWIETVYKVTPRGEIKPPPNSSETARRRKTHLVAHQESNKRKKALGFL